MDENEFISFVKKNRIAILCVIIALIISYLGITKIILEIVATTVFVFVGLYVGLQIQKDRDYLSKLFRYWIDKV